MSRPVAVDATVSTMLELIRRVTEDDAFRRLCESDLAAAVAQLESAPAEDARFEYAHDAGGHVLRVHRGGETTTVSLTADGRTTIDGDALGVFAVPEEELSDDELVAVAGGSLEYATFACWGREVYGWKAFKPCSRGYEECFGYHPNSGYGYHVQCGST